MKAVFLDTNFFIHFMECAQVPWDDIADGDDLRLIVPRTVQREIDHLKYNGNSRQARRSRKAAALFKKALQAPGRELTIRERSPRVTLTFPPPPEPDWRTPATLDKSLNDDRIIDEVLAYRHSHQSEQVYLLTNDSGPMLTAQDHGLPFLPPCDSWKLPPEPDELERTQQELAKLKRTFPSLEFSFSEFTETLGTALTKTIRLATPLSDEHVAELITQLRERLPPQTAEDSWQNTSFTGQTAFLRSLGRDARYIAPTEDEVRAYQEEQYPRWLADAESVLRHLAETLNRPRLCFDLTIKIANVGTVPAKNATLEIETRTDVLVRCSEGEHEVIRSPGIPPPPNWPAGKVKPGYDWTIRQRERRALQSGSEPFELMDRHHRDFGHSTVSAAPDPNVFHWRDAYDNPTNHMKLKCEEFLHKQAPQQFVITVILPSCESNGGAIHCKCSAANLPDPAIAVLGLKISYTQEDLTSLAQSLVLAVKRKASVPSIEETR